MPPRVLKAEKEESILIAAGVILGGGVVAVPTESFYGLAVNALSFEAVERLFRIKRRGEAHPVLILIHSTEALNEYVVRVPPVAHELMKAFWPGGLTMVFEAPSILPPILTGEGGKIGVRLSSHPAATELARVAGVAITGTSANVTGEPPCNDAEKVIKALGSEVDLILDGGKTAGGKGSTILDVTVTPPLIIREGMIGRELLLPFFPPSFAKSSSTG